MKKKPPKNETQTMINSPPINGDDINVSPKDLGKLCYSLGDLEGNKVVILSLLLSSDRTVTEIAKELDLSDSATSQQLKNLRLQGFVDSRKGEKRTKVYSIKPELSKRIITAVTQVFGKDKQEKQLEA